MIAIWAVELCLFALVVALLVAERPLALGVTPAASAQSLPCGY